MMGRAEVIGPASKVPCGSCGETVTGYALVCGQRFGVFRCGGTHCKHADTTLMRALRELSAPPPPAPPPLRELWGRIARLEAALRAHGIEVPEP